MRASHKWDTRGYTNAQLWFKCSGCGLVKWVIARGGEAQYPAIKYQEADTGKWRDKAGQCATGSISSTGDI